MIMNNESRPAKPVLIGVLLNHKKLIHAANPSLMRLKMLDQANDQANAVIFLFCLEDVLYDREMISGYYYDRASGRWQNKLFPLPDVLYFRGAAAGYPRAEFQRFEKMTGEKKIRKINTLVAFNKWELHKVLSANETIAPHLPETVLYQGQPHVILQMLQRYGKVYLKACLGRQGKQVMQVRQITRDYFEYRYYINKLHAHRASFYRLFQLIDRFFQGKSYIVQQPIDLIALGEQKIDLRAELQRNSKGELEIVAIPVRVGKKNAPITTHSASYCFEEFFLNQLGYSTAELRSLKERLRTLLFALYETIESHYGPFGEIGIDLGLDNAGKIWFIEANAQPAKVSLMGAYDHHVISRAFANPVEYALFLAGSGQPQGILNFS
jgi:hypothetical protein